MNDTGSEFNMNDTSLEEVVIQPSAQSTRPTRGKRIPQYLENYVLN